MKTLLFTAFAFLGACSRVSHPPEGMEDIRVLPPYTRTVADMKEGEVAHADIFFAQDGTPMLLSESQELSPSAGDQIWKKNGEIFGRLVGTPNPYNFTANATIPSGAIRVWLVEAPKEK